MNGQDDERPLHIPAREIPVPASVSEQARAMLLTPPPTVPPYPPVDDLDAWRQMGAMINQAIAPRLEAGANAVDAEVADLEIGGAHAFDIHPASVSREDKRVMLNIHGGAYFVGFGDVCRAEARMLAGHIGRRVISVDYRYPPDHVFPAALDDCMAVYATLVKSHGAENIMVGGSSAGGNLSAALVLRARDEGLPTPAAAVIHTPHLDMTNGGDSLYANRGLDAVLSGADLTSIREIYAPGQDYRNPYLSPVFGDLTRGYCPTFLSTGTRDLFLSDTVRFHAALRAADIRAELHVTEAASHGNFHGAPEEEHINREVRKFIASVWD